MRRVAPFLSLAACALPAQAAPDRDLTKIERALRDPATTDKVTRSIDGLTDALMSLKVGPLRAALEGREPTAEERTVTVGDLERRKDPQAEARLRTKIRAAGPAIAQGMTAVANALPAMSKAIDDIERAVDRARANMPDPTYPKR
jgi:hypothetical protein